MYIDLIVLGPNSDILPKVLPKLDFLSSNMRPHFWVPQMLMTFPSRSFRWGSNFTFAWTATYDKLPLVEMTIASERVHSFAFLFAFLLTTFVNPLFSFPHWFFTFRAFTSVFRNCCALFFLPADSLEEHRLPPGLFSCWQVASTTLNWVACNTVGIAGFALSLVYFSLLLRPIREETNDSPCFW